jgi:hypothetical protein
MSKKVTFSSDSKTFDGQSKTLVKYAKLCISYFDGKIKTVNDILSVVGEDRGLLDLFIKEALITKRKLEKIKEIKNHIEKDRQERIQMIQKDLDMKEYDPYWDAPIWRMRADRYKARIKVPILRMGCRDLKLSRCLDYQHLKWFIGFISLLHETDENLFLKEM